MRSWRWNVAGSSWRTAATRESGDSLPSVVIRTRVGGCDSTSSASVTLRVNSGHANGARNAI